MLMIMLMLMTMLMLLTMLRLMMVEPAKREAPVKVLCVLGEVEHLVNNLLNLRLGFDDKNYQISKIITKYMRKNPEQMTSSASHSIPRFSWGTTRPSRTWKMTSNGLSNDVRS